MRCILRKLCHKLRPRPFGLRSFVTTTEATPTSKPAPFVFTADNFSCPNLPAGLKVVNVPLVEASDDTLASFGARLISGPDEISCENGNFDIVKWPVSGWRKLDPNTGNEAGTTQGPFEVWWKGDMFYGTNLAIASSNNFYLDGLGARPEVASRDSSVASGDGMEIFLWMSDYHPDGGQLFWPESPVPFVVCLGPPSVGDNVTPAAMRAFAIPAGRGVYFGPGTWHNGVYIHRKHSPARFLTRQGRVHGRVSCSWASEFGSLLRVPLVK
jgi:ureidoglycolate lyase